MKHAKRHARSRRRRHRNPPGSTPGTMTVDPNATPSTVSVISFGPDSLHEDPAVPVTALRERVGRDPVTWVQVVGLGDAHTLATVAEIFGLHPLAVEDVVNVGQRLKVDDYEDQALVFLRMPRVDSLPQTEQLGLVLGRNFVVTFHEDPGDCLDPVRQRLQRPGGRLRNSGSDYLAYAIMDAVVDAYFPVLESYADRLVEMEQKLLGDAEPVSPGELYDLNRDLLALRGAVRPLRDMFGGLVRGDSPLVSEKTRVFLRDAYDHAIEVMELHEVNREMAAGLVDLYRSNLNIRLNETMKVLTIIATIFIPITFIAGIYGMNFDWMPELRWAFGYPLSLAVMAGIAGGMLIYFRRKHWL